MSTVRMSDYLKRNIVSAYTASHKKAKPEIELQPEQGDELYNRYVGPKIEIVRTAYKEAFGDLLSIEDMFKKEAEMHIEVAVTEHSLKHADNWSHDNKNYEVEQNLNEDYTLVAPLSSERTFPYNPKGGYYSSEALFKIDRHSNTVLNYMCECIEYNNKLETLRRMQGNKIEALLDKFTTLNQALKAWPALSKLVEQDKLDKVHEKQQRKRKQEQQKQMADKVVIDNDLNQTILSASLIGDDE